MDIMEALRERHSVRQYDNKPIAPDIVEQLKAQIDQCNREGNLNIQLVTNEPKAFQGFLPKYGNFRDVTDYFALVGPKGDQLHETAGYYGERLVLFAQQLGLNTCWVAASYRKIKGAYSVRPGEALACVISVGYGKTQGVPHKSKTIDDVVAPGTDMTDWFKRGVEAALLAPTAINQQKFTFSHEGRKVYVKAGFGPYAKIDLGIVKYNFEVGAGKDNFEWA